MQRAPTLYLGNVPVELYEALRRQAELSGRSLEAEAIEVLEQGVVREGRGAELLDELKRVSFRLEPGDPLPEEVIRDVRDAGFEAA